MSDLVKTADATAPPSDKNGEDGDEVADEPEVGLSAETLAALTAFALDSGVSLDTGNVLGSVREHFDIKDKEDVFSYEFSPSEMEPTTAPIHFSVKGLKKEVGQTLSSTGLTMYEKYR